VAALATVAKGENSFALNVGIKPRKAVLGAAFRMAPDVDQDVTVLDPIGCRLLEDCVKKWDRLVREAAGEEDEDELREAARREGGDTSTGLLDTVRERQQRQAKKVMREVHMKAIGLLKLLALVAGQLDHDHPMWSASDGSVEENIDMRAFFCVVAALYGQEYAQTRTRRLFEDIMVVLNAPSGTYDDYDDGEATSPPVSEVPRAPTPDGISGDSYTSCWQRARAGMFVGSFKSWAELWQSCEESGLLNVGDLDEETFEKELERVVATCVHHAGTFQLEQQRRWGKEETDVDKLQKAMDILLGVS